MARVAAAVDSGDLSLRAGALAPRRGRRARQRFDRMLARLERAFARQRDFVSDASHELRTPLAVLRAQVELLDRETDEHARREGTATLLRRLDEMDRLIDDMLTLASAEAGRLVQPRPIELEDFFEDVRRDLPLFGERDFHVAARRVRCRPIPTGSPRSCATSCATPSRTPSPADRSPWSPARATGG